MNYKENKDNYIRNQYCQLIFLSHLKMTHDVFDLIRGSHVN